MKIVTLLLTYRGNYNLEGGATYWMKKTYLIEYYTVLLAKNNIHTYNNTTNYLQIYYCHNCLKFPRSK